jgi:hypothetical protein
MLKYFLENFKKEQDIIKLTFEQKHILCCIIIYAVNLSIFRNLDEQDGFVQFSDDDDVREAGKKLLGVV